ncbi:MAG: hypothetical protein CSA24_02990 [Deltaproteobacteria bacterium]|nr:MAG: hypothetical protein CSA24_02990 [Deltaproteobacteria bacterium]
MEQVRFSIPWSFIHTRMALSWRGILFGIENGLAAPTLPVEAAMHQLESQDDTVAEVLALAIAEKDEPVLPLVRTLAATEAPVEPAQHRQVWLYLTMAWAYEHRDELADPLGLVEMIYADFGYPDSISGLIRYMPSDEPDLGGAEANERRLLSRWQSFLVEEASRLSNPDADD